MEYRPFGCLASNVSAIGQGTWYLEEAADPVRSLRTGIDLGLTHIDTAEMYGSGAAETLVARAIDGCRDQVFLVSKVLPSNGSRTGVVRACEQSLRRLGTDRLDAYLLHWPGRHPLAETVAAFESLVDSGKIRAWGVSNFDVDDLEMLVQVTAPTSIACNQVLYGPGDRTVENQVLPWCRQRGIPIVAYSPFGHHGLPGPERPVGRSLARVAHRHGVSSYQVALAFITRSDDVFTIPKAADPAHVRENARACEVNLSREDLDSLEAELPRTPSGTALPML